MSWGPQVMSLEVRKILAYRAEFWVTFLGQTLIQIIIARALWTSVFQSQGRTEMEGFTLSTLTLYYLVAPVGSRILTGENMGFLSREIYDGTFTRYLLYPLSWFRYKWLTYFTYSLYYAAQLILLYVLFQSSFGDGISGEGILRLLSGLGLFLLSSLVYFLLSTAVELIALWADNTWSLMVMLRFFSNFFGGALIPIAFFPGWAQKILSYTPFPNLVSLPARTILGMSTGPEITHGLTMIGLWGVLLYGLIRVIWAKGQRQYTGVGV